MRDGLLLTACTGLIVLWIAWLVLCWWISGVLVDWANSYWALGLSGTVSLAFHFLIFFLLGGLFGVLNRARTK